MYDGTPYFELVVRGKLLQGVTRWGDLTFNFSWPGGCNELSFVASTSYGTRVASFLRSAPVELRWGGFVVWAGTILEPEWNGAQVQVTAQGAFKEAVGYAPLDASGVPTDNARVAADQAVLRGLNWAVSNLIPNVSLGSTSVYANVAGLIDEHATQTGQHWFVGANRIAYMVPDPTEPSYHVRAGVVDLGIATDNFASQVLVLYNDLTAGTVKTVPYPPFGSGGLYEETYGHVEWMKDITDQAAISAATATTIAQAIYERTKQKPGFTNGLSLGPGEILDFRWQPVHPARVALEAWGKVVRVHGVPDVALGEQYTDFVVGSTSYSTGSPTVTMNPVGLAARDQESVATEILEALAKAGILLGEAA